MTSFPSIPGGDYRLINATVPLCLLEAADGGNARSDALASATLTIRAGKIQRLALDTHAGVAPDDDAAASNLPALDLDGGMIWPVCADLHTHLDKGQTWFRVPNTSGRWQDALALVARDRGAFWNAADVAARMDFSLRCAFVHGTAAIRTHIDSMGPQADISWPVLARMGDRWTGRIALQGVSLAMLDSYAGEEGEGLADLVADHGGILGAVVIDDADPGAALDRVFGLARDRNLDLDFHADETDNPHSNGLEAIAEATIRFGWQGRVTAGHCCSLACRPAGDAERTIARVAAAGVAARCRCATCICRTGAKAGARHAGAGSLCCRSLRRPAYRSRSAATIRAIHSMPMVTSIRSKFSPRRCVSRSLIVRWVVGRGQ